MSPPVHFLKIWIMQYNNQNRSINEPRVISMTIEASRTWDRERLLNMPKDKLIDLLFLHMRNIWSEDGLYFLGIEKRFGTEAAVDVDREVWAVMATIEARRLRRELKIEDDGIKSLFEVLKHTSWWLDNEYKKFELDDNQGVITIKECYVQKTRIKKGFGEFDYKSVRTGFLSNFVKEFNPNIEVKCNFCPLDEHPDDAWCQWKFRLKSY